MTEAEWLACTDPRPMLEFLRDKASDRKLRLFAVACCRRIEHLIADERSGKAIEVAERYADGVADDAELRTSRFMALDAERTWGSRATTKDRQLQYIIARAIGRACDGAVERAAGGCALAVEWAAAGWDGVDSVGRDRKEHKYQCVILRDTFGNFFPLATIDPSWLTLEVVRLALSIYDMRTFNRMLELSDALEGAGCT